MRIKILIIEWYFAVQAFNLINTIILIYSIKSF